MGEGAPRGVRGQELNLGETLKEILEMEFHFFFFFLIVHSQSCGVPSEELGRVLRLLGLKKKRLGNLLPLLEFITWSLLKEDSVVSI